MPEPMSSSNRRRSDAMSNLRRFLGRAGGGADGEWDEIGRVASDEMEVLTTPPSVVFGIDSVTGGGVDVLMIGSEGADTFGSKLDCLGL